MKSLKELEKGETTKATVIKTGREITVYKHFSGSFVDANNCTDTYKLNELKQ